MKHDNERVEPLALLNKQDSFNTMSPHFQLKFNWSSIHNVEFGFVIYRLKLEAHEIPGLEVRKKKSD